jgi:hypothetical protein
MNTKQEKLILESLDWIINALGVEYNPINKIEKQKSMIKDRLAEIQKEEIREKT